MRDKQLRGEAELGQGRAVLATPCGRGEGLFENQHRLKVVKG